MRATTNLPPTIEENPMSSTEVVTRCPAKVNLTFEILGTLADGYHEVCTLLQAVSLEDELIFSFSTDKFQNTKSNENEGRSFDAKISYDNFESEFPEIEFPMTESNLISKAIRMYQKIVPESKTVNVSVSVRKHIPIGSGLAGGSANAAAALVAINHYFGERLSRDKLLEVGGTLGADVPFSIQGGTCIGTHKGDVLQKLDATPEFVMVLAKPRMLSISTPWAFKQFDSLENQSASHRSTASGINRGTTATQVYAAQKCADLLSAAKTVSQNTKDDESGKPGLTAAQAVAKDLKNDLEQVVLVEHSELELLRQTMESSGAIAARLTGSGPTLYALVESIEQGELLRQKLLKFQSDYTSQHHDSKVFPLDFWIAKSFSRGARVIEQ